MAWIESHQSLKDHPKTRRLSRLLGTSVPATIGHLQCMWWWSIDYAEDGDLTRFDPMDIAIGAEWDGEASEFVAALVTVGFIDQDSNGLRVHDWHDYAGKLVDRRKANAERMRRARAGHDTGTSDAREDTNESRAAHVQRTSPARAERQNQPTEPTEPNQPDQGDTPLTPQDGADAPPTAERPKRQRRKSESSLPSDFSLSAERLAIATGEGLTAEQADHEFRKFLLHARATDRRMVDWDATWHTWVMNSQTRFRGREPANPRGPAAPSPGNDEMERRIAAARAREAPR